MTVISELELPPIFRPERIDAEDDAAAAARARAADGADAATFVWTDRPDIADCAVVLRPEQPLTEAAQMLHVGLLAAGEALAAALPALMVASHRPPGAVLLNGARLGAVTLWAPPDCEADDVPDWLVLALTVAVQGRPPAMPDAEGIEPTTVENEGCGEVTARDIIAAFGRYLLSWINRWQQEGLAPVRRLWLQRLHEPDKAVHLEVEGTVVDGRLADMGDAGELVIEGDDASVWVAPDALVRR
jgi:BirA family biotin operon repressor/biotin-[acetyl-CoA-carboxylase] ligase